MTIRIVTLVLVTVLGRAAEVRAQTALILVRHAERLDESTDSPLSPAGRQRAELLGRMLASIGVTAIYTTQFQRTVKTAEPLAARLGLTINKADTPPAELIPQIRSQQPQGTVLVVGHSNTVPEMLAALGYKTPVRIASSEYDNLFIVVPRSGEPPVVLRLRF